MIEQTGFGSSVGIVGSGRSIYVASLFILHIGFARMLGVEGYGSFQQVFLFNVLILVFSLGIPETLYFFLPRLSGRERSAFLGQTILLLGTAGIVVWLVLWFGAPFFARSQGNPAIAQNIKWFGIYGFFMVFSSFTDPMFIYYKKIRYLFFLSAVHGLFFIALTMWHFFAAVSLEGLFSAMAVFSSFKCLAAFWLLLSIQKETGPIWLFSPRHSILLQMSFALPIALTNSIEAVSRWLDKIVVSFFLGTESLGLFTVGAFEIPFVSVFVSTIYSLIAPLLSKLDHEREYQKITRLIKKALSFTAKAIWPLFVYLFVFADHVIPLVFTRLYEQSVVPFRIYLLLMPLRIILFGAVIVALGRPRIVLFGAAGSLAINLVLNIVLVQWIGFVGPAIATVASTYLQIAFLLWYILGRLETSITELLPLRKFFDIALASLVAVAIAYVLTSAYQNDLKAVLMSLTIMGGGYIFVGSRLGLFRILSISDLMRGNIYGKKDQHRKDQ